MADQPGAIRGVQVDLLSGIGAVIIRRRVGPAFRSLFAFHDDTSGQRSCVGWPASAPYELRRAAVFRWKERGTDRLGQAGIVEPDAEIVLGIVTPRTRLPRIADAGLSDEHPEGRRVVAVAIVVGHEAQLRVDGQRVDAAGPQDLDLRRIGPVGAIFELLAYGEQDAGVVLFREMPGDDIRTNILE